ncbi:MAG: guanylate kinase [Candidatus Omnitrophica bacterium]|nr:guanylate kinase [Candidatus Omnitrophota bacterium]MDD5436182.1 guanylate kinase [Candidatus Omnitrophota bacterium]
MRAKPRKSPTFHLERFRKAKLFVISAPSGSGKTTLCNKLLKDDLALARSVSMTTRPPRPGEKDGTDYHFVSEKYFKDTIKKNGFLEYEENFGYLYGTPKAFIEKSLGKGRDVLLSIDVKGAMKVRGEYPDESVFIFIIPPSVKTLKKRLQSRRSEDGEAISTRLKLAKKEMAYKKRYDYTVINDRLGAAYKKLKAIIVSELNLRRERRCKSST